ncbi:MAG: chemotaxis protein CheA, partial [Thermosynechococcaceae cyanobacterium]
MDAELQIRLNFLDEAEEYFDSMESGLLGLGDTTINPQQVDIVLRSAHSLKGGAAMMGLETFSRTAHRLEDFLKIIRVRYVDTQIETEVETLLLQGVDCLRYIGELDRQGVEASGDEVCDRTRTIFETLQQYLGDLEDADEDALMKEDEDIDPALLIFEEGVDAVLDRFETRLTELSGSDLAQELTSTTQELTAFGHMASLETFTQLCASIQQQTTALSPQEIMPLAEQALKTWRHSHALVLRGRIEKLPSQLTGYSPAAPDLAISSQDPNAFAGHDLEVAFDPLAFDADEFSDLQSAFGQAESVPSPENIPPLEIDLNALEYDLDAFSDLQSAFGQAEKELATVEPVSELERVEVPSDLRDLQAAFSLDAAQEANVIAPVEVQKQTFTEPTPVVTPAATPAAKSAEKAEKMVRVPASQLKQFNTLFEQLILSRNSINLRLQQFQDVIGLMGQRVSQIERSNTQLTQWYDRASLEGFLTHSEQLTPTLASPLKTERDRFDTLEMDRYSDIHLICQEQMETIVQLQEVATDIELSLQEVNQSVRDLNYTTQSMQGNVIRTQMLPFAEAVKRSPRIIRDLNLQSDKHVNLKLTGENTLLDRVIIETLAAPLMHLLRNAFDHGIESPKDRLALGKPAEGTITINASNQGTYTVITIADDGGGIALDRIRDRVIEMGVSPAEVAQIPEAELLNFIFEPGFSTAKQVTELSGRGVGMDVVKSNLQEVRGDVQVSTEPEKGTTFTLRIPFTLSILRVAVIEQAGIVFAIPANSIREIFPFSSEQVTVSENFKMIAWEQTEAPLIEVEKMLTYR